MVFFMQKSFAHVDYLSHTVPHGLDEEHMQGPPAASQRHRAIAGALACTTTANEPAAAVPTGVRRASALELELELVCVDTRQSRARPREGGGASSGHGGARRKNNCVSVLSVRQASSDSALRSPTQAHA